MNMKFFTCAVLILAFSNRLSAKTTAGYNTAPLYFMENKGQIRDQDGNPRNDIQYSLRSPGINIFIGNGQIHYQFSKENMGRIKAMGKNPGYANPHDPFSEDNHSACATINTYRMDMELTGANRNVGAVAEEQLVYYENYYVTGCPLNGIQAHAYKKITYRNVYNCIDWVIYINDNKLEHEFVVRPGGDASEIKLSYHGQTSLEINEDGSITATTPMGMIREHAPVCLGVDGRKIPSSFRLKGNTLSYKINSYYNALVIDPVLEWGTYYGPDTSTSPLFSLACNAAADVFGCGSTYAGNLIATTGSFQAVFGGDQDAYLVKFDSSGNRIWATYYGNTGLDIGYTVALDNSGNIYIGGTTNSTTGIATPGAQQPTYGGGSRDCFIAKFSPAGARLWATYLGGVGDNIPGSVACDNYGHVYMGGFTSDPNNIATTGSYHPTPGGGYDDFLVQYDSTGVRQWGTYFGGGGSEYAGAVCSDGTYVYLSGWTSSTTGISTPGCQQPIFGGVNDAFLAKFSMSGNLSWATYFGGPGDDGAGGVTCDKNGYIYLLGYTGSDAGIATPGCFQPARGGATDAFLAKFAPEEGLLVWCTYYGGPDNESDGRSQVTTDDSANVIITGFTASISGIASAGAYQDTFGGADVDGFLAKYNSSGVQYWSTYFGGDGTDEARGCAFDGQSIYICGNSNSDNHISTPGSFQPTGSGPSTYYYLGFLAKFHDIVSTLPGPIGGAGNICIGYPATLTNILTGGTWSSSNISVASIGSSSGIATGLSAGTATITYTTSSGTATAIVTVNIPPLPVSGVGSICRGDSATLSDSSPGGAWGSGNMAIATVGYSTGVVLGVSAGTVIISYTDTVTSCYATVVDTIKICGLNVPVPGSSASSGDVDIYPNPASDELTILVNNGVYHSFIIVNDAGQAMMQQKITTARNRINIKSLPAGVYYIILNGDTGAGTRKFVKQDNK